MTNGNKNNIDLSTPIHRKEYARSFHISFLNKTLLLLLLCVIILSGFLTACKTDNTAVSTSNLPSYEETEPSGSSAATNSTESMDSQLTSETTAVETSNEESSTTETSTQASTTTTTNAQTETTTKPAATSKPAPTPSPTPKPTPKPTPTSVPDHIIKVTIPEGFNLIQIIDRLAAAGVNSRSALLKSAENDDFSDFAVIKAAGMPTGRCWQLEGYLYPDTYEFYRNENPKSVWSRFLRNFEQKTSQLQSQLSRFGWSMDEAVVFASLLEKEAGNPDEVAKVSSVMHNRLDAGMRLELDASILYVENYIKPNISGDINRYNSYYNTYKTSALPSGAISNPGMRAFNAALNPASTDFYYFATDSQEPPVYYYSRTLEEHEALLKEKKIGIYAD